MKKIIESNLLAFCCVFLLISCRTIPFSEVQNGDFIFVTAKTTGLSSAINDVTQKNEKQHYDHVGIIEKEGRQYVVLHAAPKGGSQRQALDSFLKEHKKEGQRMMRYRLVSDYRYTIAEAIVEAKKMLGKPYNFEYILNDNSYYCSDFVERAFRKYKIFKLEPMTFKDPKTGETNEFWKTFYKKRNLEVPEGELGCNPNGLAASEKLLPLGEIQ